MSCAYALVSCKMKLLVRYLLPCLAVWLLFSWPLPKYLDSGIPASAHKVEKHHVRNMIAGDHLQLLYNFWLVGDMIAGHTQPFYNLYEFNTGDDSERYEPGSYFMPFPLVYELISLIGGRCIGWNLTGFLSLLFTHVFTFLLVRRYVRNSWIAVMAALISIMFPYRWITLLGGSPTGFAMVWVPLIFLGLDIAVRDEKWYGGLLAGAAVLLSCLGDAHVFFFGVLAIPCWCIVAFIAREGFDWSNPKAYFSIILALAPMLLFAGGALFYIRVISQSLDASHAPEGRGMLEIANYAPGVEGLFGWPVAGRSAQAYIGRVVALIFAGGWAVIALRAARRRFFYARKMAIMSLLFLGMLLLVWLALGPRIKYGGGLLRMVRIVIPPYAMVRQTAKVFCLAPTMLAVAAGIGLSEIAGLFKNKYTRMAVVSVAFLLLLWEYDRRIDPTISLLESEQLAYKAVADDARAEGEEPHVLISALWPGDTHASSVYQHYVSLYRIRMVNGYRPFVPAGYIENIFSRFDSVNMGELRPDQLDALREIGVNYVIVHEDMLPERVGAYSIGFNLRRLMNNPRLAFLKQDESVWAFEILERDKPHMDDPVPGWNIFSSARRWEAELQSNHGVDRIYDSSAGNGSYALFANEGAWTGTRLTATVGEPGQRWMLRVRGRGRLDCTTYVVDQPGRARGISVSDSEWTWVEAPLPDLDAYSPVWLKIERRKGEPQVDMIVLAAGEWESPRRGESLSVPAPCFFHSGYTDMKTGSVVFRPMKDTEAIVLYGPKLPLEKGWYDAELFFSADVKTGEELGRFNVQWDRGVETEWIPVTFGERAVLRFEQKENIPFFLAFLYNRDHLTRIEKAVFTRID